ncbi:MAG TPA: DUF3999 family protein [Polyangiales bacterium]
MKWMLTLMLCAVAAHASAAPSKDDFAYGVELAPLSQQAFHRYALPASVLRVLATPELADLCVFDARGALQAHSLLWPTAPQPTTSELALAVFPLEISRSTEGVEVKIERDANGQIARTLSQPLVQPHARAYLVDAHALDGTLAGLTLSVEGMRPDAVLAVRVEASPDLTAFHELKRATLAQLQHEGERLSLDFIELANTPPSYLRISFDPSADDVRLKGAIARVRRAAQPLPRATVTLDAMPGEAKAPAKQEFRYLVPYGLRSERYRVLLPDGTALIQASLFGADAEDAQTLALDRQIYRTPPEPFWLGESRARVLELRVDDVGGGVRAGSPRLELTYLAPEVLFAGDGSAPFTLAYGSSSARCTQLSGDTHSLEASAQPSVRALRTVRLGGPSQLTPRAPEVSPRVYALWGALLVAVAVLGVIARRLLRSV